MQLDYKAIGQRLAACRKARGLKQREVCKMVDINDKYLSNIEHARSIPSLEVIMKLCDALNVTPNAILIDPQETDASQELQSLSEQIATLNAQQADLIKDLVDYMVVRNIAEKKIPG